jgi:hypothetical protein
MKAAFDLYTGIISSGDGLCCAVFVVPHHVECVASSVRSSADKIGYSVSSYHLVDEFSSWFGLYARNALISTYLQDPTSCGIAVCVNLGKAEELCFPALLVFNACENWGLYTRLVEEAVPYEVFTYFEGQRSGGIFPCTVGFYVDHNTDISSAKEDSSFLISHAFLNFPIFSEVCPKELMSSKNSTFSTSLDPYVINQAIKGLDDASEGKFLPVFSPTGIFIANVDEFKISEFSYSSEVFPGFQALDRLIYLSCYSALIAAWNEGVRVVPVIGIELAKVAGMACTENYGSMDAFLEAILPDLTSSATEIAGISKDGFCYEAVELITYAFVTAAAADAIYILKEQASNMSGLLPSADISIFELSALLFEESRRL